MSADTGAIWGGIWVAGAAEPDGISPLLYNQLRRLARSLLRGQPSGHTLQPTALVNEAYLKVFGGGEPEFADRVHFLAVMARVMRQVLVDHARTHSAQKRGGAKPLPLEGQPDPAVLPAGGPDLLDLDRALRQLEAQNPELARIVELFYFSGMSAEEIAAAVNRTAHAVRHDLRAARAWLRRELSA